MELFPNGLLAWILVSTAVNTFGESWDVEIMFLDNLSTFVGQLNGWPYDSHMGPIDST